MLEISPPSNAEPQVDAENPNAQTVPDNTATMDDKNCNEIPLDDILAEPKTTVEPSQENPTQC